MTFISANPGEKDEKPVLEPPPPPPGDEPTERQGQD